MAYTSTRCQSSVYFVQDTHQNNIKDPERKVQQSKDGYQDDEGNLKQNIWERQDDKSPVQLRVVLKESGAGSVFWRNMAEKCCLSFGIVDGKKQGGLEAAF